MLPLLAAAGLALSLGCEQRSTTKSSPPPTARAELRSWVVALRGRHLFLDIECPAPYQDLSGRIEFTTAMLREDYIYAGDGSGAPRLARLRSEGHLRPPDFAPPPDNRIEAVYTISIDQARCLQRDRVFESPYILIGTNSNAGLRRAMTDCGLPLPRRVLASGGPLGEFPGIELDPGQELPVERWRKFGVGHGE